MLLKNHSLAQYNTFGIEVKAGQFMILESERQLEELIQSKTDHLPIFILGGGSNLLFTKDLPYLVVKNALSGRSFQRMTDEKVMVTAGAGEPWHDFVVWCLMQGFGGLENLSLIPGTVGAAPIQNIGAYGVELKDVFWELAAIDLETGEKKIFDRAQCRFGYRDSIFKNELKDKFCITEVSFLLTSSGNRIMDDYGALQSLLKEHNISQPTIYDIHRAVIEIRRSKLPDPTLLGNAGSFFKNPEVERAHFEKIKAQFPDMPSYPGKDGWVKIPAGWLIEQCGWKGRRRGDAGCYEKQALILVNYGKAGGEEIKKLSDEIANDVFKKFGVSLSREVNIL